jgi:hypothetical protein
MSTNDTKDLIEVNSPIAREAFTRWLGRGDAVGVFENVDLGHYDMGRLVFIPLDAEGQGRVTVGKTQAPDGAHGFGWRYRLKAVARSLDAFRFEDTQ